MSFVHKLFGPSPDHDYHSLAALQKASNRRNTNVDALRMANLTSASDRKVNIVIIGDSCIGKTKLVESFTNQVYSDVNIETNINTQPQGFSYKFQRDPQSLLNVSVNIWDVSGRRDTRIPLKSLESLEDPLDVVVLAFSVDDMDSHASVIQYWLKHIWKYCNRGDVEFIAVATKSELRTINQDKTSSTKLITYSDGMNLSREISARRYIEVSAAKGFNTTRALEAAIEAGLYCQEQRAKGNNMSPQGRSLLRKWLDGVFERVRMGRKVSLDKTINQPHNLDIVRSYHSI